MTVDRYDRTWEQNEALGLNDMRTENYGEQEQQEEEDEDKNKTCATGRVQGRLLEAESMQHRLYVKETPTPPIVAVGGGGGNGGEEAAGKAGGALTTVDEES